MKKVNKVFVGVFVLIWLATFVIRLFLDKGQFLSFLGMNHTDSWNSFFSISTQFAEEFAYILFAFIFLFVRYRTSLAIAFTGIGVTIVAGLLKKLFAYERPYAYFKGLGLESSYAKIEGIEPYTGLTSFPSGHAMAGFALMSLLSIYLKNAYLSVCCLAVAILVGLSRIYLGHHFIEDILFGSALGVLFSYLVFVLMEKWKSPMLDRALMKSKKFKVKA